jgi:hypothetical protein
VGAVGDPPELLLHLAVATAAPMSRHKNGRLDISAVRRMLSS